MDSIIIKGWAQALQPNSEDYFIENRELLPSLSKSKKLEISDAISNVTLNGKKVGTSGVYQYKNKVVIVTFFKELDYQNRRTKMSIFFEMNGSSDVFSMTNEIESFAKILNRTLDTQSFNENRQALNLLLKKNSKRKQSFNLTIMIKKLIDLLILKIKGTFLR